MSASEPSLGNTTKFSSQGEFVTQYGSTALRFYLLGIARELLPNERIQVCWRYPLPERKAVEIIYSHERQRARASGTMKCGSNWVCPACMQYISERRRQELEIAMERTADQYFTVMATFTTSHSAQDSLQSTLSKLLAAYNSTFSGRWWTDVKPEYMMRGSVRATEITYGDNGWHPHFHTLFFVDKKMLDEHYAGSPEEYSQSLRSQVGARWIEMLAKHGLRGSAERSLDVRTGDKDIAEYIAKFGKMPQEWTLSASAYEVSHSVTKSARNGNFGVLDILFNAAHDSKFKRLFLEYHAATKGKSALQWSQGLKKQLDIEVIRDEIAAQGIETETDVILAEVPTDLWRFIADRGYLGQVMTRANQNDVDRLSVLLSKLSDMKQKQIVMLPQLDIGH